MLRRLSIRDVVLIKELDAEFQDALTVLTGETGSGKSILLDALGLALGGRAESGLIRAGADKASVSAEFDLPKNHPIHALLEEQGLESGETLILRRALQNDGKSRAFINDQAVGLQLLRQAGQALVEIHGQFDQQGLLNKDTHLKTLDAYAGLAAQAAELRAAFAAWREAEKSWQAAIADQQQKQAQEQYLRHAANELAQFDAKTGEEEQLAAKRSEMQHHEKIHAALMQSLDALEGDGGADSGLLSAQKLLGRVADKAPATIEPMLNALESAAAELREAIEKIRAACDKDSEAGQLESLEDRLFGLRELARKYNVSTDALPELAAQMQREIGAIDSADERIETLFAAMQKAKENFIARAEKISAARRKAAKKLDAEIGAELEALKMPKAAFTTQIETLTDTEWNAGGKDRIEFIAATNPGMPAGSLSKIASGGELSRFMLALKVVLAASQDAVTLIFDEIDAGIGGSVADAVGTRLEKLGRNTQVLLVTHSPQVASKAQHHYRIAKSAAKGSTVTQLSMLSETERREEVARMLSGASITDEARRAAEKLLGAA